MSSGQPAEIVVHVDGEQGNYSLLTNYRTNRGGSVFTASGPFPGGEVNSFFGSKAGSAKQPNVLCGIAYLVRNTVTSVGSNEVSAGSELMLMVVTSGVRVPAGDGWAFLSMFCGTNGTGEGYSAADLYRIQGRPLERDNVRINVDPTVINLPRKFRW
jgi:hypothetical protein